MQKPALHYQILIGLTLGVLSALLAAHLGVASTFAYWIKPFGQIFLNLLKLTAIPLVFVSLVNGITSMSDVSRLSRLGVRTMAIYISTTIIAISIGLGSVNWIKPGSYFSDEARAAFVAQFSDTSAQKAEAAAGLQAQHSLQWMVDLAPSNLVQAFAHNGNMLQIILLAVIFSVAVLSVSDFETRSLRKLLLSLDRVILRCVEIIMKGAPLGVFALVGSIVADFAGNDPGRALELLRSLAVYVGNVMLCLSIMALVVYPLLLRLLAGVPIMQFYKSMIPAQLMAFSTSSSNATLPVTLRQVKEGLGVSEETAHFVLPLGATVNMDGTSLYQAIASVFIAQVYGIELTLLQQLGILLTATMSSIGTPGIPSAGIVTLVVILEQAGIPVQGIALILAPDRLLDMFRTVVNVTGDAFTCTLVERWVGVKPEDVAEVETISA